MITSKSIITSLSEERTFALGRALGRIIDGPVVITLNGDLGAGKTVMVRGAVSAFGVNEPVRSPTFVIMLSYDGRIPVYHFDFYRLDCEEELETLGLDDYLEGQGAAFIEWGLKFENSLPAERLDINIDYDHSDDTNRKRIITFSPRSKSYSRIIDNLFENVKHWF